MSTRSFIAGVILAVLANVPSIAGMVLAETRHAPYAQARPSVGHRTPPLFLRARRTPASSPTYSLVDDGTLDSSKYSLGSAVAFNNTGQVSGSAARNGAFDNFSTCVVFDGKKFRVLTPAASIVSCTVNGINNQNAVTGAVDIVANGTTVFSNPQGGYYGDEKAIFSTIVPRTGAIATTVFPNDESFLTGVNDGGRAIGVGVYQPVMGFATPNAPLVTAPGKGTLSVLQPSCSIVRLGCAGFPAFPSAVANSCGFGGCNITSDGTIFLIDLFTGSYELVKPDGTTQDIVLAGDVLQNTPYEIGSPIINSANQLLYAVQHVVAGVSVIAPQVYDIGVGPVVTVPPIAGNSCKQYIPLSFNDEGTVFGIAYSCVANDPTYFTYDSAHGTRDLATLLPTSGYVSLNPHAVNDKGQILVDFIPTAGAATHWGLLAPPTSASAKSAPLARRAPSTGNGNVTRAGGRFARLQAKAQQITLAAAQPALTGAPPHGALPRFERSRPHRIHLRSRSPLAGTPAYSIIDYGTSSSSAYTLADPVAFNNTGQIVGSAVDSPYVQSTTCILFDGARFRNITASPSVVNCSPRSINDLNPATGQTDVVGTVVSAFSYGPPGYDNGSYYADNKAFLAKIAPRSGTVDTSIFAANDTSDLLGINAGGLAIGIGYFSGYSTDEGPNAQPPLYVAPGKNSMQVLQPSCTLGGPTCNAYILEQPCAFGGCVVTSNGTIFLNNTLITPDGTAHAFRLPDNDPYRPIINNSEQLLYQAIPQGDARTASPVYDSGIRLYQIATGKETSIPKIADNTCDDYAPLSFNNSGTIIGYAYYCPATGIGTYFIYDAVNGTRDLMAQLPSGDASVSPIGINDKGQILVGITLNDGAVHWGILQPAAANKNRLRSSRRSADRFM